MGGCTSLRRAESRTFFERKKGFFFSTERHFFGTYPGSDQRPVGGMVAVKMDGAGVGISVVGAAVGAAVGTSVVGVGVETRVALQRASKPASLMEASEANSTYLYPRHNYIGP